MKEKYKSVAEKRIIQHVHAHFGTNPAMVALLTRMLGGPPYSFTVHGPEEFDSPAMLYLRTKVTHSAFVATITDFARSQTCRWSDPIDWPKTHVVRCGLDEPFTDAPIQPIPNHPRLLCIGRIGQEKAHPLLIEAVARLTAQQIDCQLILVGDGPRRDYCTQLIRQLGLDNHITLTGWLDGAAVRKELLACRAMVLPSFGEGLPVSIMESFALARPVISTCIAGIPELVKDGVNGWLITPGNLDQLVDAMREALELARLGGRYSEAAALPPQHSASYPGNALGTSLRRTAALIRAGVGVRAVAVDSGSWDHHQNLRGNINTRAGDLASSLAAFFTDLGLATPGSVAAASADSSSASPVMSISRKASRPTVSARRTFMPCLPRPRIAG